MEGMQAHGQEVVSDNYLLLAPLKSNPPTIPAVTARPLTIATPISPSLETLSSINILKLSACRFAGSCWSSSSLYRFASA